VLREGGTAKNNNNFNFIFFKVFNLFQSLPRSLFYLALDLVVIAGLYLIVPMVEQKMGLIGLILW
jgi:hypothetical protein